jgi:formate hydrogenlyase subunit 6/NADH:ubiquinone oxidoreductase subunit I
VSDLLKLFGEILGNLKRRPATIDVPFEKIEVEEIYRGLEFLDIDKCIGCGACALDCPAAAIEMVEFKEVNRKLPVFIIGRCVFCAQCEDTCPYEAIKMTREVPKPFFSFEEDKMKIVPKELRPLEKRPQPKPLPPPPPAKG